MATNFDNFWPPLILWDNIDLMTTAEFGFIFAQIFIKLLQKYGNNYRNTFYKYCIANTNINNAVGIRFTQLSAKPNRKFYSLCKEIQ